jgi:hypothetical protein
MNFFFNILLLCLAITYQACAIGDLMITNTTLGLLRITITRDGIKWFRSPAIDPGTVFKKIGFLSTGDLITFTPADNTIGPILLEDYTVGSVDARTADVIINYKGDSFETIEK